MRSAEELDEPGLRVDLVAGDTLEAGETPGLPVPAIGMIKLKTLDLEAEPVLTDAPEQLNQGGAPTLLLEVTRPISRELLHLFQTIREQAAQIRTPITGSVSLTSLP